MDSLRHSYEDSGRQTSVITQDMLKPVEDILKQYSKYRDSDFYEEVYKWILFWMKQEEQNQETVMELCRSSGFWKSTASKSDLSVSHVRTSGQKKIYQKNQKGVWNPR